MKTLLLLLYLSNWFVKPVILCDLLFKKRKKPKTWVKEWLRHQETLGACSSMHFRGFSFKIVIITVHFVFYDILYFLERYSHTYWKSTHKWSLTCFKIILKISYSNSLLTVYIAVFLKSNLLFSSFYFLLFVNKTLRLNDLKTRQLWMRKFKCSFFVL